MNAICTPFDRHLALQTTSQVDCRSGFDSTQCDAASLGGTVSYPIDWTVGTGAVVNEDWCTMTLNTAEDERPSDRSRVCDPEASLTEPRPCAMNSTWLFTGQAC